MQSRAREEELLQAAETGDVTRLRNLVLSCDVNIDATDQLGRTPLHLAVVNDRKDVSKVTITLHEKRQFAKTNVCLKTGVNLRPLVSSFLGKIAAFALHTTCSTICQ